MVALLHRAGEVLDERLDERDGALARFRRILEIDRRYQPALASCGRLYFRSGRWDDLYNNYEQELAITLPGPASVALLDTMGKLAEERLGREEMAIDCYRRAIKADPKHSPSLEALATILRERERWPPPEAPTVLMPPGLRHALSLPGTENQVGPPLRRQWVRLPSRLKIQGP